MNRARTILMAVALIAATANALADSYTYLTVGSSNGETSYEVSTITKITFSEENMILWNGETKTAELPLSSLDKMFFSATASGISTLQTQGAETRLQDGVLRVKAKAGQHITLFNLRGQAVREATATADETEVSLLGLAKGVYIVKVGEETKKILNK